MKPITADRSHPAPGGASLSPAVRIVLAFNRGYKILISPLFRGSCRFVPSCADYSAEAFRRHGLAGGSWLTVRRLARCHPFCRPGHDPVPETWPSRPGGADLQVRRRQS